ncbi:proteoglycan 4-like [Daphnia carinata]|uniref:proteoglycan 4-like n=1 Tax=Daphnia carinata TaxID=120202 RepID=UPI00257BEF6F|nr:proteoglycan 4-like [Daphnia carinata]
MKETPIVFNAASIVLFATFILNIPCVIVASRRVASSRQSSAGYLDPYKFAYAIKTPLPFHGDFGQTPAEGASSNVHSTRERLSFKQGSRSATNKARSISSGQWSVDDDALIALSASIDESTFGERIAPRGSSGRQQQLTFQPSQQFIVTSSPSVKNENRSELNKKEILEFFASVSDSQPASDDKPSPQRQETTEPSPSEFQDTSNEQGFSKSNDGLPSVTSLIDSQKNNNDGFQIESSYFGPHSRSNPSDWSTSHFPSFGPSFSVPDIFRDTAVHSVETELAGREVGSPGSVSSSIDALYAKFSPFPQQESFRLTDFSTQLTPIENTAERPFTLKVHDVETFNPPLSKEIAPHVQAVSAEPPAFVPSTPFKANDFLPSRYPELRPPSRTATPTPVVTPSTESIKPFQQPRFPEPNKYAGFIPQPLSGPGDSFTQFPKPNFPTFPSSPSKTVYFGGHPNEPPTHLQKNIVSFIKSRAVPDKVLSPPNLPAGDAAYFPGNFIKSFPFKTRHSNAQVGSQKSTATPVSKVNVQPVRSPPSNVVNLGPAPPKAFTSNRPKQNSLATPNNVKPQAFVSTVASTARPPTTSPIPTTETNKVSSTPKPLSTTKPTRFVASPLLSHTKPIPPINTLELARPIRVAQHHSQQVRPHANAFQSVRSPVQQAQRGTFSGWTGTNSFRPSRQYSFISPNPFVPVRNPPIPISKQIRQVLPSLTKNPAAVPVLAPLPVYLQPASVTLPQRPSSKTSSNIEKAVYYHAFVSYG